MNERVHRYAIGTQYIPKGKRKDVCTVIDQLTTRNSRGDVVELRYVSTHEFLGQIVTSRDVAEATIARGLLRQ